MAESPTTPTSTNVTDGGNGGGSGVDNGAATTTDSANLKNRGSKHTAQAQLNLMHQEQLGLVRQVGSHAVWTLSSCKHGCGVDQLRDNDIETYWQSDGPQPHLVNIMFRRKTTIQSVCIYLDFKQDESYTPRQISIRAGNHFHDLEEIENIELEQPAGWIIIPLKDPSDQPVRANHIQLAVLSNHQGGRDTHLRQVKIYSPVSDAKTVVFDDILRTFSTVQMTQHFTIR